MQQVLHNDYLRTILLLVSSVFIGYTLQPVPKWLNKLFDTSHIFKFLILFTAGCVAVYPVNNNNIKWVVVCSILTLVFFHVARKYDDYLEKQEKKK